MIRRETKIKMLDAAEELAKDKKPRSWFAFLRMESLAMR